MIVQVILGQQRIQVNSSMLQLVDPQLGIFILLFVSKELHFLFDFSSGLSVICKARFLSEFKQLCLKMCHPCNIHLSYNQLKKFNEEYFQKKQMMIRVLEQSNFGSWSDEKIHFEQFKYSNEILPIIRND